MILSSRSAGNIIVWAKILMNERSNFWNCQINVLETGVADLLFSKFGDFTGFMKSTYLMQRKYTFGILSTFD